MDDLDEMELCPQTDWSLDEAVELCRKVEEIAPRYGAHVALTGGCLYKDGRRKDVDIHFYRIRQVAAIDEEGLLGELQLMLGITPYVTFGWVTKALYEGKDVDLFFPERPDMPEDERYS